MFGNPAYTCTVGVPLLAYGKYYEGPASMTETGLSRVWDFGMAYGLLVRTARVIGGSGTTKGQ